MRAICHRLPPVALSWLLPIAALAAGPTSAPVKPTGRATDLVLRVRVEKVYLNRLRGSRRHHIVQSRVLRVVQGKLAGKTRRFDFRVHSPSRAGLRPGAVVLIRARRVKGGYLVDEAAIRTPRCYRDEDCELRDCCCRWRALLKGATLPATCHRRCRCRRRTRRPAGVRCNAGGTCESVEHEVEARGTKATKPKAGPKAPSGCYKACLERSAMQAVSWQAIQAQCRNHCAR